MPLQLPRPPTGSLAGDADSWRDWATAQTNELERFGRETSLSPTAARNYERAPFGKVSMFRVSDSTNDLSQTAQFVILTPDGSELNTAGSTTGGIQEAFDYIATYGYDLEISGGTTKAASSNGAFDGQAPSLIRTTTPIFVPPLQMAHIAIRDISIISSAPIGIQFDSLLACVVDLCWGGQIVMDGANSTGVLFSPQTNVPQDGAFGIGIGGACHVRVGSVVVPTGGAGKCVVFDRSGGFIGFSNTWLFSEPNGGAVGIRVTDGAHAFTENYIRATAVHGQTSYCVQVGQTVGGNPELIGSNHWELDCHPATGGVGYDTWASGGGNYVNLRTNGGTGTAAAGIVLESAADGHIIDLVEVRATTIPVQDLSTAKGNLIRSHTDHVNADLNGTNQIGIVSGIYTKVLFGTLIYNTNVAHSTWDGTNHRWTPGIVGPCQINAQVKWTTTTDTADLRVAIFKNGTMLRGGENLVRASGTGGGQGASIGKTVFVDTVSDYFEIYAAQLTGVNQDISGDTNETWATFTRLSA